MSISSDFLLSSQERTDYGPLQFLGTIVYACWLGRAAASMSRSCDGLFAGGRFFSQRYLQSWS